jgi:hypothetical protein
VIKSAVSSPVETTKFLGGLAQDINPVNRLAKFVTGKGTETPNLDKTKEALVTSIKDRYGSLEKASKTAIEDPFGVGSDILSVVSGGAGALGKGAALSKTISTVGGAVTKPVAGAVSGFFYKSR